MALLFLSVQFTFQFNLCMCDSLVTMPEQDARHLLTLM